MIDFDSNSLNLETVVDELTEIKEDDKRQILVIFLGDKEESKIAPLVELTKKRTQVLVIGFRINSKELVDEL